MNILADKFSQPADLSKRLIDTHDLMVKSAKIAGLVGAVCGFVYLFAFTLEIGIPFPFEFNVLPTTLLIVGITSILGTFIVVAGMFVPALRADDSIGITGGYLKAEGNSGVVRLIRYFFCTWIPLALTL